MKATEKISTVYVAGDGTEFETENECVVYGSDLSRKDLREAFVAGRCKTPRSEARLRNLLKSYDAYCASEGDDEKPQEFAQTGLTGQFTDED